MPAGQVLPVRHAHAQGDRRGALAREAQGFGQLEGQQLVGGHHQHVAAALQSAQGKLQVTQGASRSSALAVPSLITRVGSDGAAAAKWRRNASW